MLSWVIVPFMKMEPPYTRSKIFSEKSGTGGMKTEGKRREGKWIERWHEDFLKAVGLKPCLR